MKNTLLGSLIGLLVGVVFMGSFLLDARGQIAAQKMRLVQDGATIAGDQHMATIANVRISALSQGFNSNALISAEAELAKVRSQLAAADVVKPCEQAPDPVEPAPVAPGVIDASLDTVIYETVSTPSEAQSAAKMLSALSLTPQGRILVGLLSAAAPANKQTVARWIVPGKVRPTFLGASAQGMEFRWVDAQTGAERSDLLDPIVPK